MTPKTDRPLHHPYGPSRWPGLCVCPNYTPGGADSEYTARGRAIHLAVETGTFDGLCDEDRETAMWMCGELDRMTQGIVFEQEVGTEIKNDHPDLAVPEEVIGVYGTCDATWPCEDGSRAVVDLKGFSKIGLADYRAQLAGYCLGLPVPSNGVFRCHVFHGGSRKVESFDLTLVVCIYYARQVAGAIANPCEPCHRSNHCDHCVRVADCPESAKVVAFGHLCAGRLTRQDILTHPADAARLCDWLDMAAKRIEEARDLIADCAKAGTAIEDPAAGVFYGVQERMGKASVPPVGEIMDRLAQDGVSADAVMEKATLPFKALQELVGKNKAETYAVRGEPVKCFVRVPAKKALKT